LLALIIIITVHLKLRQFSGKCRRSEGEAKRDVEMIKCFVQTNSSGGECNKVAKMVQGERKVITTFADSFWCDG